MNSFNSFVRLKRSLRAISPVLSVLMMIAIAVAASLVAYAWIMGYIGGTTIKTGQAIQIQSITSDENGNLVVYVQNVGQGPVTINGVYVNDTLRSFTTNMAENKLEEGKTATVYVDVAVAAGEMVTVKIVTSEGMFTELKAINQGQGTSGPLNIVPTAAFTWTANGLTVTFDASGSSDPDGSIVSYAWDFGDGTFGTGVNPTRAYAAAGTYTVRLTVTDNGGATDSEEKPVTVTLANQAPVLAPIGPKSVNEGALLMFDADATDPNAGDTLTFSLIGEPSGASIDAATGVFT
ncbi:MAG: PKD domain-containing protein, partial [Candidatus Bathyarchaeia archaeon]